MANSCCMQFIDDEGNLILGSVDRNGNWTFYNTGTGGNSFVSPATPVTPGGGGDSCPNCVRLSIANDGTVTVTQSDDADFTFATGGGQTPTACTVSVSSNGQALTGTATGVMTFGCEVLALTSTQDPEDVVSAGDFPEGWHQVFTGGLTGTEEWAVYADLTGNREWKQVTA